MQGFVAVRQVKKKFIAQYFFPTCKSKHSTFVTLLYKNLFKKIKKNVTKKKNEIRKMFLKN